MPCLCGTPAGTLLSCLQRHLGVPSSAKWDEAAHRALYLKLSTIVNVQANRHQTAAEIASVGWGAEADNTGVYAGNFPTSYIVASDPFWSCVGVSRDEAYRQSVSEGPYRDAMVALMQHVRGAEQASPDKSGGVPWWGWALGGVAVVGGAYLLLRE